MKALLEKLSYLGVDRNQDIKAIRPVVLANQINLIAVFSMLLILIISLFHHYLIAPAIDFGTLRVLLLFLAALFNLFLVYLKKNKLARVLTAIAPAFFFIYFPSMMGFVEDESFVYYPYVTIAFSIIPHFITSYQNEKTLYIFTNIYAFITVVVSDLILFIIAPDNKVITDAILEFYVYYKTSHILIYGFINLSIIYLKRLNRASEETLNIKNEELSRILSDLKETQNHLIQTEKMASLGMLISGIAHEINTPLNFINLGIHNLEYQLEDQEFTLKEIIDDCQKNGTKDTTVNIEKVEKLKNALRV